MTRSIVWIAYNVLSFVYSWICIIIIAWSSSNIYSHIWISIKSISFYIIENSREREKERDSKRHQHHLDLNCFICYASNNWCEEKRWLWREREKKIKAKTKTCHHRNICCNQISPQMLRPNRKLCFNSINLTHSFHSIYLTISFNRALTRNNKWREKDHLRDLLFTYKTFTDEHFRTTMDKG